MHGHLALCSFLFFFLHLACNTKLCRHLDRHPGRTGRLHPDSLRRPHGHRPCHGQSKHRHPPRADQQQQWRPPRRHASTRLSHRRATGLERPHRLGRHTAQKAAQPLTDTRQSTVKNKSALGALVFEGHMLIWRAPAGYLMHKSQSWGCCCISQSLAVCRKHPTSIRR